MFKKVLTRFFELGTSFDKTGALKEDIVTEFKSPYELTKFKARLYQFCCVIGLNNFGWHSKLKKNNALHKRLDRPFL